MQSVLKDMEIYFFLGGGVGVCFFKLIFWISVVYILYLVIWK